MRDIYTWTIANTYLFISRLKGQINMHFQKFSLCFIAEAIYILSGLYYVFA